ncbi:MAG: hypothetical protein ABEI77_09560 [Halorientalis sp.]
MSREIPFSDRTATSSRRRVLAGLASVGAISIAGCSQDSSSDSNGGGSDGDGSKDNAGSKGDGSTDDSSSGGDGSSGGGGGGCPTWGALTPYDVSGTKFAVVPSFPTDWERYRSFFHESAVEVGFGIPDSESKSIYSSHVVATQLTSKASADLVDQMIQMGAYEEGDPTTIGGEEIPVGVHSVGSAVTQQLAVPDTAGNYHSMSVVSGFDSESCADEAQKLGRQVIDSFELNTETTL